MNFKKTSALLAILAAFVTSGKAQQALGDFTSNEQFEWPKVIFYRDLNTHWDDGIIKTAPNTSGINRSGFGIHMHESRQFTFWSTNFNPLLSIEGGSGNTYIRGNLGIGTNAPSDKLSVNGNIRAREIKVDSQNWPDYVFEENYKITPLADLETYIKQHKHLPDMPSAKEIESNGASLGELVKLQQQKIEELTLHLIEKDKEIKTLLQNEESRDKKYEEQAEKIKTIVTEINKLKSNDKK
ncbi:hypothetical protein ACJVDH_05570 [Pedobacter sp. AW1-32]|uniref:hypothetical protein n=1 Tax=Pedobacter sp. AW1-32 TaxID=3383026 RepID=UPI003FEFA930